MIDYITHLKKIYEENANEIRIEQEHVSTTFCHIEYKKLQFVATATTSNLVRRKCNILFSFRIYNFVNIFKAVMKNLVIKNENIIKIANDR